MRKQTAFGKPETPPSLLMSVRELSRDRQPSDAPASARASVPPPLVPLPGEKKIRRGFLV